ncbi:hypothetical protein BS50DRAFT_387520 [Corynespora cassiicola Philippines]|uniref:Uncharacterized protein n=1 Tax=Corynespora cassiicola Philippines TaxID=1448308 RepID=A0A2T2NPA0_CORCC|nr:hypothetical protein BS50DRAFT_387520 [Corynespora cassiicola Philippines]
MSMMALRRNPLRKCKSEMMAPAPAPEVVDSEGEEEQQQQHMEVEEEEIRDSPRTSRVVQRRTPPVRRPQSSANADGPFRFFDLPREVRDHVYSYLVVRRGKKCGVIEAKPILRGQKKRLSALRTRERLNQKRALDGRRPIVPRELPADPVVHLAILQASRLLHYEASDCLYKNNWFALSLDSFPAITAPEAPPGWDPRRISRMQLELQLKDAQRMNGYVDWAPFFASFPSLRFLRVVPTFHVRYYEWASTELRDWRSAHYVFRAFFRELLASVPEHIALRMGAARDPQRGMQLEGRALVDRKVLWDCYAELGARRDVHGSGRFIPIDRVVEC